MKRAFVALLVLLLLVAGFIVTRSPFPGTSARTALGTPKIIGVQGQQTRLYISGDGPAVLLFASAGREASDFNELIRMLVDGGYMTIAIEAPGIGGSDLMDTQSVTAFAQRAQSAIKALDLAEPPRFAIGHAFGNRVARTYSALSSQPLSGVILIAAGANNEIEETARAALTNIFNPLRSTRQRHQDIKTAFFAPGNDIPSHWKKGWHMQTAIAQGKAKDASENLKNWERAGGVSLLVIQAQNDRIAPKEDTADRLKALYPNQVEVILAPNAGHALLPEQPDVIAQAVLSFLNNTPRNP